MLILAIVGVVGFGAGFGWLITTYLFAFSGGQVRMVPVVGYGVLVMALLPLIVAVAVWRLRSPLGGFIAACVAVAAGWVATLIVEWGISFFLGS